MPNFLGFTEIYFDFQVVDAKVIQLDYNNNRIFLSLKDVKPNPSVGALEAVIGEELSLGGALEPAEADFEWPEVDALMEEMKNIEEVRDVYKGRFLRSPGLAPTFQVYMAPLVGQKYKLLARYGNNVQEVWTINVKCLIESQAENCVLSFLHSMD
jgi:hypothetical protein